MGTNSFKGTGLLTKLLFRQVRFKIVVWLLGIVLVTLATASAYPGVYKTKEDMLAFALTMDNPAMIAMLGPGTEIENYSIGAILGHEMLLLTALAAAAMSILLVSSCTRADEEDGRLEMIRSLPVGRLSYLSSAFIIAVVANVLLAIFTGVGLGALGIDGIDWGGSFLYGAILGATGLIFASLTAILAQVSETSKGTTMLSFSFLILFYLVRAIGDVSNETLSLFSPLGWIVRGEVFIDNKWWPVLLTIGVSIIFTIISFYLNGIRDSNAGFLPQRNGKDHASAFLKTPIGLIFRLQRTNILTWGIILFLLSASFGSILGDLETYFSDMDFIQAFLGDNNSSMTDQFVGLLLAIMALMSGIPAVMTMCKLKSDEIRKHTEHFYSRSVSRTKIMGSYLLVAIIVSFIMQALVAIGFWSVGTTVMEEGISFGSTFMAAMVYLPAIWILIGFATFIIGFAPKGTGLVWLYFTFCFIVLYLGGILDFPDWINNLSSYESVPDLLTEDMEIKGILILTVISFVLACIGMVWYNKRDIEG